MNARTLGIGAALTATLLWGMQFPVLAAVLPDLDPFWLTLLRYLIAFIVLAVIVAAREGRAGFSLAGRGWTVAVLGVLGFSVFNVLLLLGLRISGPQHGALIMATLPLMTVLIGWIRGGAMPSLRTFGFIALAFSGVALVVTKGDPASVLAGGDWIGDLMMLVGASLWATYTSFVPSFSSWSPIRYTMAGAFFGTCSTIVLTAGAMLLGYSHAPSAPGFVHALPGLLFLSLFGAVVALIAWNIGIAKLGSSAAVLFMNVVPITAFAIAIAFGARYPLVEYIGAAITIGALVLNNVLGQASRSTAVERNRPGLEHESRVA